MTPDDDLIDAIETLAACAAALLVVSVLGADLVVRALRRKRAR